AIPAPLETIVLKAMAKEPARRYATAAALREDLQRFLDNRPILGRPVTRWERAWTWARRQPVVAALAGGLMLALVLGILASSYFAVRAGRKATEAQANAQWANQEMQRANAVARIATAEARRAEEQAQRATEQKRISVDRLYLSEMSLGQQAWHEGLTELAQQ